MTCYVIGSLVGLLLALDWAFPVDSRSQAFKGACECGFR